MKIIILNDFAYVNGGASQVALLTAVALAKRKFDVLLFTGVGSIDENLKSLENLKVVCLEQYDILNDPNRLRAAWDGLWNRNAAKVLKLFLKNYDRNETVVHVHTCQKALSSSCIHVAIEMGFNVVYHMHDYGVACPNLGFYNYKVKEICKKKPLTMACFSCNCDSRTYLHKIWRCLRQWVQIYIGKVPGDIKNFIAVSKFSYDIIRGFLPVNAKVFLLKNPVDMEKEERIKVENNDSFIFIGRLASEKNPVLLAEVAKELNVPVIFIGSGDCEKEIMETYPEAQITGWLKKEQIKEYIYKGRCLVLTSSCYETQGLVVNEMAGYGMPAIVADTCAACEYICEGKNGEIFNNNDVQSLKNAMLKIMKNSYLAQMSNYTYDKFWNEENGISKNIEQLIEIYEKILKDC